MLDNVGEPKAKRLKKACCERSLRNIDGKSLLQRRPAMSTHQTFVSEGTPAKETLSAPFDLKTLQIPLAREKWCIITSLPESSEDLRNWLSELQLLTHTPCIYRGEGMPVLTQRMLIQLLHKFDDN